MFELEPKYNLEIFLEETTGDNPINFVQSVELTNNYWSSSFSIGVTACKLADKTSRTLIKNYKPKLFVHPSAKPAANQSESYINHLDSNNKEFPLTKNFGEWTIEKGDFAPERPAALSKMFDNFDWIDYKKEILKTFWYFLFTAAVVVYICEYIAESIPIN